MVSIDDRSLEGMKFERILALVRNSGQKVKFVVIRKGSSSGSAPSTGSGAGVAPPPTPRAPPPAPPRSTSLWSKAGENNAYPWKLVIRKDFVSPSTRADDANDLALVTAQVLGSDRAKNDKSKLKQLKASGSLSEILDVALDWPMYFCKKFACAV